MNQSFAISFASFGMPATARSVLRAIVCAGRSRNDSGSSDDDRLDLLGDEDVLGDGLQWHLHEEEQTEGSISGIEGTLVTPGGPQDLKGVMRKRDHLLLGGFQILKGRVVMTKWLYR